MNEIKVGSTVVVHHEGEKKTARVVRLFTHEEIFQATAKATVVTADKAVTRIALKEAAYAADQRQHTSEEQARAAAYLMDSAWYPALDEATADLMTDVFLDLLAHERAMSPTVSVSAFAVALSCDWVLQQALAEHRVYTPVLRVI